MLHIVKVKTFTVWRSVVFRLTAHTWMMLGKSHDNRRTLPLLNGNLTLASSKTRLGFQCNLVFDPFVSYRCKREQEIVSPRDLKAANKQSSIKLFG